MTQDQKSTTTLGLATVIYQVPDIGAAKAWYARAFGQAPYFDQPFYVGFEIGGYELGLHPDVSEGQPGPGAASPTGASPASTRRSSISSQAARRWCRARRTWARASRSHAWPTRSAT